MELQCDVEVKVEVEDYKLDDQDLVKPIVKTEYGSDPLSIETPYMNFYQISVDKLIKRAITPSENSKQIERWKKYPWLCSLCNRWPFLGYESLNEHILTEHKGAPKESLSYNCTDCSKAFPCYSIFLNHVRLTHHSDWKLCCDVCDNFFDDYKALSNHRKEHINTDSLYPIIYMCFKCGRAYPELTDIDNHIKLSHCFMCCFCKLVCLKKTVLAKHIQEEHTFFCNTCGMKFNSGGLRDKHSKLCYIQITCEFCRLSFNTLQDLNDHTKSHFEPVQFKCDFCNEVFLKKVQKIIHEEKHRKACNNWTINLATNEDLIKHETEEMNNFLCKTCENGFLTAELRNNHEKVFHTRLKCEFCQEKFNTDQDLRDHVKTHFNPVKFKCDFCEEEFLRKCEKITHERIHRKRDNTACNLCSMSFSTQEELKEHESAHKIIRFHKCDICQKSFQFLKTLNNHLRVHEGAKIRRKRSLTKTAQSVGENQ